MFEDEVVDVCLEVSELLFLADAGVGSDTLQPAKGLWYKCLCLCFSVAAERLLYECVSVCCSRQLIPGTQRKSLNVCLCLAAGCQTIFKSTRLTQDHSHVPLSSSSVGGN